MWREGCDRGVGRKGENMNGMKLCVKLMGEGGVRCFLFVLVTCLSNL